nr:MAG TPA: hypothetical protein [Caudoviricetes sp.]
MERLTDKAWRNFDPWECCGQDKYCQRGCHDPGGCTKGCIVPQLYARLGAYEDTELTPEEINDLASAREISPEAEYAINKHADSIIERLDKLLTQTDDDARLRELAEADKGGRVVVLPCRVGDTLFRVFAGEILEHKVRNMRYLAIQGRWDIDTTPFCSYVESSIGKTIFLTREEAEAALKAMKDE